MRKFIAPEINFVEIVSEDVIMVSTLAAQNSGLTQIRDNDGTPADPGIWTGVDDSWV